MPTTKLEQPDALHAINTTLPPLSFTLDGWDEPLQPCPAASPPPSFHAGTTEALVYSPPAASFVTSPNDPTFVSPCSLPLVSSDIMAHRRADAVCGGSQRSARTRHRTPPSQCPRCLAANVAVLPCSVGAEGVCTQTAVCGDCWMQVAQYGIKCLCDACWNDCMFPDTSSESPVSSEQCADTPPLPGTAPPAMDGHETPQLMLVSTSPPLELPDEPCSFAGAPVRCTADEASTQVSDSTDVHVLLTQESQAPTSEPGPPLSSAPCRNQTVTGTCYGCAMGLDNQQAHMGTGGCVDAPSAWNTTGTDTDTSHRGALHQWTTHMEHSARGSDIGSSSTSASSWTVTPRRLGRRRRRRRHAQYGRRAARRARRRLTPLPETRRKEPPRQGLSPRTLRRCSMVARVPNSAESERMLKRSRTSAFEKVLSCDSDAPTSAYDRRAKRSCVHARAHGPMSSTDAEVARIMEHTSV